MAGTEQNDDLSVAENSTSVGSMERLAAAEARVLQHVKSKLEGFFVPISNNKRIWTIKADPCKPDTLPVIMVHGYNAAVGFWLLNIDAIAEHRAVYAFDLLGFGRSSRPKFSEDASIAEEEFVNSIEEWRERVGLETFILLGHSFGGFLSASYAIKYPDRVQHLILADPWGIDRVQRPFWQNVIISEVMKLVRPPTSTSSASWGMRLLQKFRPEIRRSYGGIFPDDRFLDYSYLCITQKPPSGDAAMLNMQSLLHAVNPILPRLTHLAQDAPILFIYGQNSWTNWSEKEPWRRIIPGAGHQVFADKPAEFNRLVVQVCEEADRAQQSEDIGIDKSKQVSVDREVTK